jgi:hypothetical protein
VKEGGISPIKCIRDLSLTLVPHDETWALPRSDLQEEFVTLQRRRLAGSQGYVFQAISNSTLEFATDILLTGVQEHVFNHTSNNIAGLAIGNSVRKSHILQGKRQCCLSRFTVSLIPSPLHVTLRLLNVAECLNITPVAKQNVTFHCELHVIRPAL